MSERYTPLYMKLKDDILSSLSDAAYYSPLPGERELSETFGVSRPTVRKSLQMLEKEGQVERLPGKGSFYLGNKIHVDSHKTSGIAFYAEVVSQGKYTRSHILQQNAEYASPHVAARLNIDEREMVFHLERLRYIGDELYSLANAYIPLTICPELIKICFTDLSLHDTLRSYGIFPTWMDKVLEIKPCNEYEAMHLELNLGDPVSVMQTFTHDADDRLIEYAITKSLAYKTRYEMRTYNEHNKEKNHGRNDSNHPK